MRIVLTGGGTGGHLTPFEPIIEVLRTVYLEQRPTLPASLDPGQLELIFLGIVNKNTSAFFSSFDIKTIHIPSGKLRRYASPQNVIDLLVLLPLGIVYALWQVWRIMPDVVISKGGYGSVPILFAAWFYRIPFVIHESDAEVGLSNRLAARFAAAITVGFAATREQMPLYHYKTFVTGTPIRTRFGRLSPIESKKAFGFAADETVVLILGGSQGAQQLNEVILQVLPSLVLDVGIIHMTGEEHFVKISAVANELLASSSRKEYYKPFPYLADALVEAMTAADVIVTRAGATTLAELTRLRKPSLLIPLDTAAHDHQRRNAQVYERLGAARVLDPSNLGKNLFARSLKDLVENANLRQEFAQNLAQLDTPRAARDIADLVFKLASGLLPKKEV